jgi:hypothetical protein
MVEIDGKKYKKAVYLNKLKCFAICSDQEKLGNLFLFCTKKNCDLRATEKPSLKKDTLKWKV